jgi:hypothetical protein
VDTTGKKHEVELDLGGMGGGGAIQLEVISCSVDSSVWIRQEMYGEEDDMLRRARFVFD